MNRTFLYRLKNIIHCHFLAVLSGIFTISDSSGAPGPDPPFYSLKAEYWADSVMLRLSPIDRISQLFMVAAWSNQDSASDKEIVRLIHDEHIGGLIFFQGGPVRQALLTNQYQSISNVPLMIGIDGEWGLAMRLDSTLRFPRQMTLSAIPGDSVVYRVGHEIALECKRMGIHVNFAPDADINNNPSNPVIGSRSFGDDRETVTRKALLYMHALQDEHVLASAKHFPGHGNADSDSHLTLPVISQSAHEIDSVELYPFRKLIQEGLGSMMVAHLNIPALDSTPDLPSTLSQPIVTGLLTEQMNFRGLIFTDALKMKGVSARYKPGMVDKLALLAGNDILLYSEDVRKAKEEIRLAVKSGEITQEEIDRRVKKLLMAKYWCGLNHKQRVDTTNLIADLNSPDAVFLQRQSYEKSLTLLYERDSIIPLRRVDSLKIASVVVGDVKDNSFQQQLKLYAKVDCYALDKDAPVSVYDAMFKFIGNYDLVILSLHGTTVKSQTKFGIQDAEEHFIENVLSGYKTVFVNFGNAFTLSRFNNLSKASALIEAYEDFSLTQQLAAQLVMGGLSAAGRFPINCSDFCKRNMGMNSGSPIRLKYTVPEDAGLRTVKLLKIDSIVNRAIAARATPGCQVMVVKDQKVIYQKSFGTKTYDEKDTVINSDLYDVASVTKIAATSLAVMKLYEQGKINLNQPLSKYLTRLKSTNKKQIILLDVLAHQAGLQSWVPFWKQTMTEGGPSPLIYSKTMTNDFSIHVADSMFMMKNYADSILQWIYISPLEPRGKYVYSDFGPILMKSVVEKLSHKTLDKYATDNFYEPLQLSNSGFLPLDKFPVKRIVPTQLDTEFRHQFIRGYVNDPAAAMLGGVSGNAGLFSNANDLAVIMQMLLNKGKYGGEKLLDSSTISLFTHRQFPENHNRRGLLFDKPEPDTSKANPCTKEASPETFGHQGFTGTCVWVDPKYNLVYIFLSNRVCPDVKNEALVKMNVRTNIQQVIYDAILHR